LKSLLASLFAVLSAFVGIRRKSDAEADQSLRPWAIVVVAIVCVLVIVATLITIVRFVLSR
jgi:hypothetical protein